MSTLRQAPNGKWQVQIRKAGSPPMSKTFSTKPLAESWAKMMELDIERGVAGVGRRQLTIRELFEKYRDEVAAYRKGEKWDTARINAFLNRIPGAFQNCQVNAAEIAQYLRDWRDSRVAIASGATVNREMSLLSSVFSHGIKEGWIIIPANPISLVKRPPTGKPRKQRCSQAELIKIVGDVPTTKPEYAYDYLPWIAHFAVETAMRMGEIIQLTWNDIDIEQRTCHIKDEWSVDNPRGKSVKNGTDRDVPLSKKACDIVNQLSAYAPDDKMTDKIFPIEKTHAGILWRNATKAAGLSHIHFHDLRREGTTRIAAKVKDVLKLSAITGHKDLKILASVYYSPNMRDLAAELD